MDTTVTTDDPGWGSAAERALREQVRRLELALVRERTPDAALLVSCRATEAGVSALRLELVADGRRRVVESVAHDLVRGIAAAFEQLLGEQVPAAPDRAVDAVERVFAAFVRIAEREIALAELEGRIHEGTLDPGDAVDDAVAEVLPRLAPDAEPAHALGELRRSLASRLAALSARTDALDRREPAPAWPRVAGGLADAELGDEDPDAWFPVEDFDLVELLADAEVPDPAAELEEREVRERLVRAMFRLDRRERRDWAEVTIGGWAVDALAAAQGRPEAELRLELGVSRAFLAVVLGVSEEQVEGLYRALGERYRDERRELA